MLGKLLDGEVAFVSGAQMEAPKTREFAKVMQGLEVSGSSLVVLSDDQDVVFRSARNLARTRVRQADDLNAHDVVMHRRVIFTDEGFERLLERVGHDRD